MIQTLAVTDAVETAMRPDGDAIAVSQADRPGVGDGGQVVVLDVESGEQLFDPLVHHDRERTRVRRR